MITRTLILVGICALISNAGSPFEAEIIGDDEILELREAVREMFQHGYNSYMTHAFPHDELKPISCVGFDSFGRYSLTLIDALDTLVVMGNISEFERGVRWVSQNVDFNTNISVSVFETTIRVLGGLISAHVFAVDLLEGYNNELLILAEDLGRRLLYAFETPTGMPYGTVNLMYGVPRGETTITCTAGVGTFSLEFGVLSKLTGNPAYENAARKAVRAMWARRSELNLLGNHIDVATGEWTHRDSGIGAGMDSFFEYLLKAAVYFQDQEYLDIFVQSYDAINRHVKKDPWYVEVQMSKGAVVWPLFNALQSFWPGTQTLAGDIEPASLTLKAFHSVWRRFGFTPEGFNLVSGEVQPGQKAYPLRPELAESLYYMFQSGRDPTWAKMARDMIHSINTRARLPCGFAGVADVETSVLYDHMDSFFLSETCKYLYLIFDPDNFISKDEYIFNTEGHPYRFNKSFITSHEQYPWQYDQCEEPSFLRKISCDQFSFVGVIQEQTDGLHDLLYGDDFPDFEKIAADKALAIEKVNAKSN